MWAVYRAQAALDACGIPFAKMFHGSNRDLTGGYDPVGSSFLLAYGLRLASADASLPA